MQELPRLIEEAAPFAGVFGLAGGLLAWIVLRLIRKKWVSLPLAIVSAVYMGFLLHGTCVNRMDGLSDFLRWELPDFRSVWWNFELGARTHTTAVHAVLNVALFIPWGFLGMCWQRKWGAGFLVLLSGMLMSACIEFFQVTHGMVFDLGDVLTNSIGTAAGCAAGIPVMLFNGWIYSRRKRKRRAVRKKEK